MNEKHHHVHNKSVVVSGLCFTLKTKMKGLNRL